MVRTLRETGNVKSNNSDLAIRNATIAAKKWTFYRYLLPIELELYVELFVKSGSHTLLGKGWHTRIRPQGLFKQGDCFQRRHKISFNGD